MARRLHLVLVMGSVALALAGCASSKSSSTSPHSTSPAAATSTSATTATAPQPGTVLGFEGMPLEQGPELAPPSSTGTGMVHGINCGPTEQLVYHIHIHLAVYVNGQLRALPAGIGIPGSTAEQTQYGPVAVGGACIYWLHTHTTDGVIHVESPSVRIYSLGDFFAVWRQPLSSSGVAGASGKITAFVNGKPWKKNPAAIPLIPHAEIQLDVGSPIAPFKSVSWKGTSL